MRKGKSTAIWIVLGIALIAGLFAYPKIKRASEGGKSGLTGFGAPCLAANMPLLQHIHSQLFIEADGVSEPIPPNIGIGACERAIHTHIDDAGKGIIHIESQDTRTYRLGDFFAVWEKSILREGYALEATVDEKPAQNPAELILKDGQKIVLRYIK